MKLLHKTGNIALFFYSIIRNSFRRKKLHTKLLNNTAIAYYPEYNKTVRDYYLYCVDQICCTKSLPVRCNIIFGPYEWTFSNNYKTINICLQSEHTLVKRGGRHSAGAEYGVIPLCDNKDKTYLVRIADYTQLIKADIVIDYSRPNIININSSGLYKDLSDKLFHFWPLLYKYKPFELESQYRDLNLITMFGNPDEPYRKNFISILKAYGIHPVNINNSFNNVESIYRRSKILINIRQTYTHHTLEELRILPALLCGTIVICESAPLKETLLYNEYVLWAALEDLPYLIIDVVNNYEYYYNRIFGSKKLSETVEILRMQNNITAADIIHAINDLLH